MATKRRATMGVRTMNRSLRQNPSEQDSSLGFTEVVPDRELIRRRALELRPDLAEREPKFLSPPFTGVWTSNYRRQPSEQPDLRANEDIGKFMEYQGSGKSKHPHQSLHELSDFCPDRLGFRTIELDTELDDEWYELVTLSLFLRAHSFSKWVCGNADHSLEDWKTSPWLQNFSDDFVLYAAQVSRGDPLRGGWDALLRRSVERTYLVTGIIAMTLDTHVFSQLLFGANEEQRQMLKSQDVATINFDGYRRTAMRAEAVKACLEGPDSQPAGFWPAVDQLAVQTTALLLPLITLRGLNDNDEAMPNLQDFHQEIHNIVAEAAFLSNMMRRSSSVFNIEFPRPGDIWNLDQEHVRDEIYKASQKAGITYDEYEQQDLAAEAGKRGKPETIHPLPLRVGMVQIVLWPNIKRFTPIDTVSGFARKGEMISTIIKSQVVYYSGREDDDENYPTLFTHIRTRKLQRPRGLLHVMLCFVWLLLCLALLSRAYNYYQSGGLLEWHRQIAGVVSNLASSESTAGEARQV